MADLFADQPVPLEEMLGSVRREVGLRRRVYPHWVELKKMTPEKASQELRAMEAVESLLEYVVARRLTVERLREIVG